jgi:hypothetical protein
VIADRLVNRGAFHEVVGPHRGDVGPTGPVVGGRRVDVMGECRPRDRVEEGGRQGVGAGSAGRDGVERPRDHTIEGASLAVAPGAEPA